MQKQNLIARHKLGLLTNQSKARAKNKDRTRSKTEKHARTQNSLPIKNKTQSEFLTKRSQLEAKNRDRIQSLRKKHDTGDSVKKSRLNSKSKSSIQRSTDKSLNLDANKSRNSLNKVTVESSRYGSKAYSWQPFGLLKEVINFPDGRIMIKNRRGVTIFASTDMVNSDITDKISKLVNKQVVLKADVSVQRASAGGQFIDIKESAVVASPSAPGESFSRYNVSKPPR